MPTSALYKFNDYVEQEAKGVHNWSAHTFKMALTNVAPTASDAVLADITQIANGGGYLAGGFTLDSVTLSETSGVAKLTIADEVITATGGNIADFRYGVVYNDSATGDPLCFYYDYGSATGGILDGDSFTFDFDASAGVWTKQ